MSELKEVYAYQSDEIESLVGSANGNSYYLKSEADEAIAELKAIVTTDNSAVIARLEEQLRKTQRALWHDRAIRAEHMKNLIFEGELIYHDDSGEELDWRIMYRKWERAETACRAKAKEYE